MNQPTTLIGYLRVSTAGQADNLSLPVQEATIRAESERRGATLEATYSDIVSGALYGARSGLQDALSHIERLRAAGTPCALIVARWDRTGRDVGVLSIVEARLRRCGAGIVSCDGTPGGDSASDRLSRNIHGVFGHYEREVIGERTAAGKAASARSGKQPCTGLRPYGYRIIMRRDIYPGSAYGPEDAGRYVVVEEEARIVREVFAAYATGQWSLRGAAAELNRRGLPTLNPRGQQPAPKWRPATIYGILRNPVYVGRARYGVRDHDRYEGADGKLHRVATRRADDEVVTIACPAIVDHATFAAAQSRLATNQRTFGGNPDRRHLLSGILRCPGCGRALLSTAGKHGDTYYRCRLREECSTRHWRGEALERVVIGAVAEMAQTPGILAAVLAAARTAGPQVDIGEISRAVAEAVRREAVAADEVIQAAMDGRDPAPYRRAAVALSERARAMERELLAAREVQDKAGEVDTAQMARALGMVAPILSDNSLPLHLRAEALRMVVRSATPFDAEPPRKRSAAPTPGAVVEIADGVGCITIRATLSGDGVAIVGADGG